jgi:hypothetical protein
MRSLGPELTYVQDSRSNQRIGLVNITLVVFPEHVDPGASDWATSAQPSQQLQPFYCCWIPPVLLTIPTNLLPPLPNEFSEFYIR